MSEQTISGLFGFGLACTCLFPAWVTAMRQRWRLERALESAERRCDELLAELLSSTNEISSARSKPGESVLDAVVRHELEEVMVQ